MSGKGRCSPWLDKITQGSRAGAILAACPGAREIGDRAQAIASAIAELAPDDLLVIAGKGHETGQTVAGVVHPFDDRVVARAAVDRLASEGAI